MNNIKFFHAISIFVTFKLLNIFDILTKNYIKMPNFVAFFVQNNLKNVIQKNQQMFIKDFFALY